MAHSTPITIGTKMKWVKYVSEATLSHQCTVDFQKCCCSTMLGSLPKNKSRSMLRTACTCNGNLMPKILPSAAPRVVS